MLTMYLRKAPSPVAGRFDVVGCTNESGTDVVCRWEWHLSNKPTRRNRSVMFNCARYRAVWID